MYPGHFPALARCIPALALSSHSCASSRSIAHLRVPPRIFAFHRASSRSIAHLRVPPRIFAFHRTSLRFTAHLRIPSHIFAFHRASSHSIAHLCISPRIFAFHRASLHFTAHLRIPSRIFAFHCDLVRIIAGASIHCPASSLVRCIPFITISDYVWYCTIIISLWTLTLPHLHT
jgi:hypothetical protein